LYLIHFMFTQQTLKFEEIVLQYVKKIIFY